MLDTTHNSTLPIKLLIPLCKSAQAVAEGGVGFEAEVLLKGGGVGVGDGDIAWLHCHKFLVGFEIVVCREDIGAD